MRKDTLTNVPLFKRGRFKGVGKYGGKGKAKKKKQNQL